MYLLMGMALQKSKLFTYNGYVGNVTKIFNIEYLNFVYRYNINCVFVMGHFALKRIDIVTAFE